MSEHSDGDDFDLASTLSECDTLVAPACTMLDHLVLSLNLSFT